MSVSLFGSSVIALSALSFSSFVRADELGFGEDPSATTTTAAAAAAEAAEAAVGTTGATEKTAATETAVGTNTEATAATEETLATPTAQLAATGKTTNQNVLGQATSADGTSTTVWWTPASAKALESGDSTSTTVWWTPSVTEWWTPSTELSGSATGSLLLTSDSVATITYSDTTLTTTYHLSSSSGKHSSSSSVASVSNLTSNADTLIYGKKTNWKNGMLISGVLGLTVVLGSL